MNIFKKAVYYTVKNFISLYMSAFIEFKVWGRENIPEGARLYCSNHFSSTDPFFALTIMKEPVHMVVGPGFSVPIFRHILKAGEQINALPQHRHNVLLNAVKYLNKGESVYIFPEGDLNDQNKLRDFYPGLAKIHLMTNIPIIPIGIIAPKRYVKEKDVNIKIGEVIHKTLIVSSGKYYANIGKPVTFNKNLTTEEISQQMKEIIEALINDIKINKFWE